MNQPSSLTTRGNASSLAVLEQKYEAARAKADLARLLLDAEVQEAIFTRRSSRQPNDPYVARLYHIASLYQDLLEHPVQEDHHVLTQPYFGKLSLLDQLALLEGDEEHSPGLATLDHDGYGIVHPTEEGWSMVIDGEPFLLSGEMMHDILVRNLSCEPCPYINPGVLPTRDTRASYDGMTVVIPARDFVEKNGEECEVSSPIRLSLHYERYAELVWSVAYAKYGTPGFEYHGEITERCYGTQRVPENMLEASFWHDNFIWRRYNNEEKEKFFLPGYSLQHLTPQALDDFEIYASLYRKEAQKRRQSER